MVVSLLNGVPYKRLFINNTATKLRKIKYYYLLKIHTTKKTTTQKQNIICIILNTKHF